MEFEMVDFENEVDGDCFDLTEVDFDVDRCEVLRRIETVILLAIEQLVAGDLPVSELLLFVFFV